MSSPAPLVVSALAARGFLREALALETPLPDIDAVLARFGCVQIDPINICGRMHDLILRHRVTGYREGDLMRHLHGESPSRRPEARTAFEHHAPDTGNLMAFPLDAWPHLQAAMRARQKHTGAWSGRLTPRERELTPVLLREIAARGPLSSEDFDDERRAHRVVWGAASLVKATLQKLFFHGRLLIAQRTHNRRRYDLPERVLPAAVLAQPEPTAAATSLWLARLKLRQRRLVLLKREERTVLGDAVLPVHIAGCAPLYCLREDASQLASWAACCADPARTAGRSAPLPVHLLAPLDPLIYDRRVTAALWNFDYTWEAYTPPHKRVRGYYALPVLAGTEIIGHVDPKADRPARRLRVLSRRIRRGHKVSGALDDFARWLGLRR